MKKEKSRGFLGIFVKFLVLIVIGVLIWFFLRETYKISIIYAIVLAMLSIGMLYYFWGKGFFYFFLTALVGISFFVSLEISFDLPLIVNFLISVTGLLLFGFSYIKWKHNESYALLLLIAFAIVWIIIGFNVLDRKDWVLENVINVPFVVLLFVISKWFRFSKLSYSLFFVYMFMNIIGSHYTYSEVPFGFWLEGFLGLQRNHYDRIIHFLFGFLLAYPMREVYVRIGNYKGIWSILAPITMVFGLSCVYELLEWGIVLVFASDLGVAYLGSQGDVWDAQKDMFLAGVGSIIAMVITFIVIMVFHGKAYWIELKDSFKVRRAELGEVALQRWKKK